MQMGQRARVRTDERRIRIVHRDCSLSWASALCASALAIGLGGKPRLMGPVGHGEDSLIGWV